MSWSFKLFSVKGIDIKIHLTFFLILIWAAWQWSGSTGQGVQGALFGIIATLLLFGSVTLHELSHSMQARRVGVQVKDITLLPMGGLAQIEEMPKKPLDELRIALAGPLINFVLAGLLVLLGTVLGTRSLLSLGELSASIGLVSWPGLLAYLTMANLALGIFNLIPAYPMDGGRVLRALLAMRMDHNQATRLATRIGQGLALLIGLWGLLNGSYTFVLVAIFVWMGAGQENREVNVEAGLHGMQVHHAMTRAPYTLKTNDSLSKAVELTLTSAQSDFPVLEWGTNQVVGLLIGNDLLKGLKQKGDQTAIREVMQTPVATLHPDQPLYTALEQMAKYRLQAIPVVDEEHNLVGLLTSTDINEAYRLRALSPQLAPASD